MAACGTAGLFSSQGLSSASSPSLSSAASSLSASTCYSQLPAAFPKASLSLPRLAPAADVSCHVSISGSSTLARPLLLSLKPAHPQRTRGIRRGRRAANWPLSSHSPAPGVVAAASADVASAWGADVAGRGLQKGWFYSEYGGWEKLQFGDVPLPELRDDQVLIKVAAAALNPVDFKRRLGKFANSDSPLPTVPGYDVAGTVVKVGPAVTRFREGDQVYGDISEEALNSPKQIGSLAQFTAVEERLLALKPKNLSYLEAAALPLAILTAQEAFDRSLLSPGQSVLILNGAGGVGSLAIQLARKVYKAGLVDATASAAKASRLIQLGADNVIDYKTAWEERPQKYDFVLDAIGEAEKAVKVVKEGGVVAVLTGPTPPPSFRFVVTSIGENLAELTPYIEADEIVPVLDNKGPFKFQEVPEAFQYLESGRAFGKIVIGPIE